MWILSLDIKHDCTIGNRCEHFGIESYSIPLSKWHEDGAEFVLGQHILLGDPSVVDAFVADLRTDRRAVSVERNANTVYLLERHQVKIPARLYDSQTFFVKPVHVDRRGHESWELASFEKSILTSYLQRLQEQEGMQVTLLSIARKDLKDVHYPEVMPALTDKQKRAFEIAVENGYYAFPRQITLEELSTMMGISISTYQEHLRRAEQKLIPRLKP